MVKHFIAVNVVSSLAPGQITDYMRLDNSVRNPPYRNELLCLSLVDYYIKNSVPTGTLAWYFRTLGKLHFEGSASCSLLHRFVKVASQ